VRRRNIKSDAKHPVFGMVERGGRVIAQALPEAKEKTVLPALAAHVDRESILITDSYTIYDHVKGFSHERINQRINHHQQRYVAGPVHTNTIENFWSCLKRMLKWTYVAVQPQHLGAYVQEQVCRFNYRKKLLYSEEARFQAVVGGMVGKRLTYKQLIGAAA
jgi:transposase-like protein